MFALIVAFAVLSSDLSTREANRLREAATVLEEIQSGPDKDIPQELWDRAECVIVVPGLKAEILSYSRTQGLFAGVNLSGGVVRPDPEDNTDLYGKSIDVRDVVMKGTVPPPAVVEPFMEALRRRK